MSFSDRTIEEIKAKLSIVDVVSSYTQVFNRSNGFWIKCPFHGNGNERTPSCKLNLERNSFYCFACQEHGSMFDFVMKMEHITFPEAVRELASRAGVSIEDETPQERVRKEEKTSLYELNEQMAKVFHQVLLVSPEAEAARDYLAKRKITQETIERFRLGYAPKDSRWLHDYMVKAGYSDSFLQDSGFFSKNKYPYPLFCNRLMFPVSSWQGKVVAFGARDLSFRDDAPKYINTPDTAIYSKKHNLYAFYECLETIKKEHTAIVCEGNFDAISLNQAGLTYAVAPFGTAFTSEQAGLLSRYVSRVQLLFDTDNAGMEATSKAITMLQEKDIPCEVLSLDRFKDASEYLEKAGGEALRNSLNQSIDGFRYLVNRALSLYNTRTPKGKSEFVGYLAPFLNATKSNVEKDAYVRQIAEIIGTGEVQIRSDLTSFRQPSGRLREDADQPKHYAFLKPGNISPDLYLMLMFANHRELFASYTRAFRFGDLKDREAQIIYLALENVRRDGIGKTDELFLSLIADDQVRHDVATSFELPEFKVENPEGVINEILDRMALRKLEEDRRLILLQIRQGEVEGLDEDDLKELLNEKVSIDCDIRDLKEKLQKA